ncbi:MAG TPA: NUDIX domain-containing protein [Candidatus Nanoarchaeia archaeon]|nr:NUDIX domain-containing protein [Candidatus Nanoarchaeia archaeon]
MSLPWLSGVICLLHKEGKTLFIDYRNYPHKIHQGKYSPPGGKVDSGEMSSDAAIRETFEETNIRVGTLVYRGKVHFNNEQRTVCGLPMKINMTVEIYESFDFDDSQARAMENKEDKVPNLEWIAHDKIIGLKDLHEGDRKMFEWLGAYKEFEGTISQVGESLGEFSLKSFKN